VGTLSAAAAVSGCATDPDAGTTSDAPIALAAVAFASTAVIQLSSRCMDVFGAQTGDDVDLIQWNCHGGTNPSFTFTPVAGSQSDLKPGPVFPPTDLLVLRNDRGVARVQ